MPRRKSRCALDEDLKLLRENFADTWQVLDAAEFMEAFDAEAELILFHALGEDRQYVLMHLEAILRQAGVDAGSPAGSIRVRYR